MCLTLFAFVGCSIKNIADVNAYPREINPSSSTPVESPDSLKAMLRFSSKKNTIKGRAALTIKSPDLIRIEIYNGLGQIMTVVAGDSKHCSIYSKGKIKSCEWNDPTLPVLISPIDLVPILLGKGKRAFTNSKQRQNFSDNFGRLTQVIASQNNKTVHITIGDYRTVQGFRVPFSFVVQSAAATNLSSNEELTINYYRLSLDPTTAPSTFNLTAAEPTK